MIIKTAKKPNFKQTSSSMNIKAEKKLIIEEINNVQDADTIEALKKLLCIPEPTNHTNLAKETNAEEEEYRSCKCDFQEWDSVRSGL